MLQSDANLFFNSYAFYFYFQPSEKILVERQERSKFFHRQILTHLGISDCRPQHEKDTKTDDLPLHTTVASKQSLNSHCAQFVPLQAMKQQRNKSSAVASTSKKTDEDDETVDLVQGSDKPHLSLKSQVN